ncbi:MAG: radical SAM protein [Oscillospiraceae bacterium]|nr:radical SAM protein [Oscillospiraceae bacterium]
MCDVIFITPNMSGHFSDESVGTLQLVSILENEGVSCDILQFFRIGDVSDFEGFMENAMDLIQKAQPKIVSMYTRCDTYHINLKLAQRIKARWDDIYIVFGGPQSDITAEDTVSRIPYVDYVCCGEGETTIYPFFSSLLRKEPDLSVPGLVYRTNDTVVKNPRPEMIAELDGLPMIDYSKIYMGGTPEDQSSIRFPIDVGRGCPFGCTYCSTKAFWGRKYRMKSPRRIIEEIKLIHDQFGITKFKFSHDMFTLNRKIVIETCDRMRGLDFPVEWVCSARLDCLDRELIDIMADSGLFGIFIGIETGSPRMQKLINKNLKLDRVIEILSYLRDKGIAIKVSFIYGFPEETEDDLSQTMSLMGRILQHKCGQVDAHLCTFLAKTELSDRYMSQMTRAEKLSNITGSFAIEECADVIDAHPQLFSHLMEYKTELRTKLKHFELFFRVWARLQPVYQYLAEQYSEDRLIDMYYDFVAANQELLAQMEGLTLTRFTRRILLEGKLPKGVENDPNRDILSDYCRMIRTENSEEVRSGGNATAIYCFDPSDRTQKASIRDYERCVAVVTYNQGKQSIVKYPYKIG